MWKAVTPYRSLRLGLVAVLAILLLLVAFVLIAVRTLGMGHFLLVLAGGAVGGWTVRRLRRPYEPPVGAWTYASAMTYGLPDCPPFRTLNDHQRAVRRVFALRRLDADEIVAQTSFPRRFVESVLSYLDDGRDGEGGAGVGARLRPKGPGPLTAAE